MAFGGGVTEKELGLDEVTMGSRGLPGRVAVHRPEGGLAPDTNCAGTCSRTCSQNWEKYMSAVEAPSLWNFVMMLVLRQDSKAEKLELTLHKIQKKIIG